MNRDFLGREYPASEPFEVGREHIRQFADAIGDSNPIFRDRTAAQAAGHRDVVAPPTFLTVLTSRFAADLPLEDPALGLDFGMVVHGSQGFTFHRPVCAGDRLSVTTRIDEIRPVGRHERITMVSEVTDADGAPVATTSMLLIVRAEPTQAA
jgi:acyl dehydratase